MTIKWSKKLCIEYSQQMKSKLEEIARQSQGNGGNGSNGHNMLDRVRLGAQNARKGQEILERERFKG